jgi:hypothetical protein
MIFELISLIPNNHPTKTNHIGTYVRTMSMYVDCRRKISVEIPSLTTQVPTEKYENTYLAEIVDCTSTYLPYIYPSSTE